MSTTGGTLFADKSYSSGKQKVRTNNYYDIMTPSKTTSNQKISERTYNARAKKLAGKEGVDKSQHSKHYSAGPIQRDINKHTQSNKGADTNDVYSHMLKNGKNKYLNNNNTNTSEIAVMKYAFLADVASASGAGGTTTFDLTRNPNAYTVNYGGADMKFKNDYPAIGHCAIEYTLPELDAEGASSTLPQMPKFETIEDFEIVADEDDDEKVKVANKFGSDKFLFIEGYSKQIDKYANHQNFSPISIIPNLDKSIDIYLNNIEDTQYIWKDQDGSKKIYKEGDKVPVYVRWCSYVAERLTKNVTIKKNNSVREYDYNSCAAYRLFIMNETNARLYHELGGQQHWKFANECASYDANLQTTYQNLHIQMDGLQTPAPYKAADNVKVPLLFGPLIFGPDKMVPNMDGQFTVAVTCASLNEVVGMEIPVKLVISSTKTHIHIKKEDVDDYLLFIDDGSGNKDLYVNYLKISEEGESNSFKSEDIYDIDLYQTSGIPNLDKLPVSVNLCCQGVEPESAYLNMFIEKSSDMIYKELKSKQFVLPMADLIRLHKGQYKFTLSDFDNKTDFAILMTIPNSNTVSDSEPTKKNNDKNYSYFSKYKSKHLDNWWKSCYIDKQYLSSEVPLLRHIHAPVRNGTDINYGPENEGLLRQFCFNKVDKFMQYAENNRNCLDKAGNDLISFVMHDFDYIAPYASIRSVSSDNEDNSKISFVLNMNLNTSETHINVIVITSVYNTL